jgi:hypothetical protein
MSDMKSKLQALGASAVNVAGLTKATATALAAGPIATTPADDVRQKREAGF